MAWDHVILETFCMYSCSKDKITESFRILQDENGELIKDKKGMFKTESCGKHKNSMYIPGGEKKRPKWCKKKFGKGVRKDMTPDSNCVFDDCPYLAMVDVSEKEREVMLKAWFNASEKGEFDDDEINKKKPRNSDKSKKVSPCPSNKVASPQGRGTKHSP